MFDWFRAPKDASAGERSHAPASRPLPTREPSVRMFRRQPVMVPRDVAGHLAPHVAEHPELAPHVGDHVRVYQDTEKPPGTLHRAGNALRKMANRVAGPERDRADDEQDDMVDLLDVLDPEVSTLSTLTNVQNSLFVPQLGRYVNRRPAYQLSDRSEASRSRLERLKARLKDVQARLHEKVQEKVSQVLGIERPGLARRPTLTSVLSESRFAVLPHGEKLVGWTHEEKLELDDMVRHELHSRRAKVRRAFKGFGKYVRRPLGLFVTVYATLITLFGAAWVLFLIGWISLGSKRDYVVNIVDNVLVALFAIMGDGLAPFRAVDTYHMMYIAYYYRKTMKIRRQLGLPDLADKNDLPELRKDQVDDPDVENRAGVHRTQSALGGESNWEYSVLSEEQQLKLEHHERKFSKSHTFYKPHETATHYAFPLKFLIAIVVLLDMHSCLQITLGACTWGIPYKHRPFALTTVILCCSITCNITGGVLISIGDRRTRKTRAIEQMMRQELTAEMMEVMERRRLKQAEEDGMIDPEHRKRYEEQKDEAEWQDVKRQWKDVPLLPKKLLGKGADHREPALPQAHRGSNRELDQQRSKTGAKGKAPVNDDWESGPPSGSEGDSSSSILSRLRLKKSGPPELPPVSESEPTPAPPLPARPGEASSGAKDKIMRVIRRADMDLS